MKTIKFISIFMALLILSSVTNLVMAQEEQLTVLNGDFSQEMTGWSGGAAAVTEDENIFARFSAKGTLSSPRIAIEENEHYLWQLQMRTTKQIRLWIRFYAAAGDKSYVSQVEQYVSPTGGEWDLRRAIATAPAGAVEMELAISVFSTLEENEAVDIDNVSVKKHALTGEEMVINPDMESHFTTGMPKGFAVSETGCTIEKTNTHGSSKTALCISSDNADSEVTVDAFVPMVEGGKYDVSAYMNAAELSEGSTVQLVLYKGDSSGYTVRASGTGFFTKTKYDDGTAMGWRKMMLCYTNEKKTDIYTIRVTLKGKGKVYLDDFSVKANDALVRNTDFEGFTSDYQPAGEWGVDASKWGEDQSYCVLVEENGNHYVHFTPETGVTSPKLSYVVTLTAGKRYVLQADTMSGDDITETNAYSATVYVNSITEGKNIGTSPEGNNHWVKDFSIYFTAPETKEYKLMAGCRTKNVTANMDNIRLLEVNTPDNITFSKKDGQIIATFTGFGTDYVNQENNRTIRLFLARYTKTGDGIFTPLKKTLEEFTIESASPASVVFSDRVTCNVLNVGEVPLTFSAAIDIPAEGEYVYKALAWDEKNMLSPYVMGTFSE